MVILLNNYTATGIGDFGVSLASALMAQSVDLQVEELSPSGNRFIRQLVRGVSSSESVVANIGLTSWGRSPARNILGFLVLGVRSALGRRTVVILHNVIEVLVPEDSGFQVRPLTKWGAHLAVTLLSHCKIAVVSESVSRALRTEYGREADLKCVQPCPIFPTSATSQLGEFTVVTLGYLAPYKGLDLLVDIAEELRGSVKFLVVGTLHRLLKEDPILATRLNATIDRGRAAGIEFTGRVSEEGLPRYLERGSLGVLTYRSTGGGSASFSTLAGAGIPVVATDLPEFRYLKEQGAGIILAQPSPGSFAEVIDALRKNPVALGRLSEMQTRFAAINGWASFASKINELLLA